MIRSFGVLTVLLAVATAAEGQCVTRTRTVYYNAPYVAPTYVAPVGAVYFSPLVIASVPAYSSSYGADQSAAFAAEIKALRAEIRGLKAGLLNQPQPQPLQAQPPQAIAPGNGQGGAGNGQGDDAEFGAVLNGKCAACHTGASAKGSFALFAAPGQPGQLTPRQIGEMLLRVQGDAQRPERNMPPGKPLNDREFSLVTSGLAKLLTQASK